MRLRVVSLGISLLLFTRAAFAAAAANGEMMVLVVDKTRLRADLKTWPEDPTKAQTLASLRIAIGKNEGDKQVAGDNKTPEGIYFSQAVLSDAQLPAKYGPKAIPINFPNPFDALLGKTGHGIWLHGVEQDTRINEAKVTEGCVAFYNADINALSRWLRPYQTVVMIGPKGEAMNRSEDLQSLRLAVTDWANAWAKRQLESYMGHYAREFRSRGMGWAGYRNYKARVFSSYQNMQVNLSDIRVFTNDRYGMVVMNQDFSGDRSFSARGRKLLYWQRASDGVWKIRHEDFENRRLEFGTFSPGDMQQSMVASPSAKYFGAEQQTHDL